MPGFVNSDIPLRQRLTLQPNLCLQISPILNQFFLHTSYLVSETVHALKKSALVAKQTIIQNPFPFYYIQFFICQKNKIQKQIFNRWISEFCCRVGCFVVFQLIGIDKNPTLLFYIQIQSLSLKQSFNIQIIRIMQDNFLDSDPNEAHHIMHLPAFQEESYSSERFYHMIADNPTAQQKSPITLKQVISCSLKKRKSRSKNKMIRRITKTKAQKESAYKKNICGYITKKVIREFICGNYKKNVKDLCQTQQVELKQAQDYYENKIETVTGPSHLSSLFSTDKSSEIPILRVFVRFFKWFIQERYMRHLVLQGKMQIKKAYIDYKNKKLLPIVCGFEKVLFSECQTFTPYTTSHQIGEPTLVK